MEEETNTVELAVALTTAWLGNPNTRCAPEDIHAFLKNSHATLVGLSQAPPKAEQETAESANEFKPAVSVRKSLADPDYIVSMIDGKRYRSLRRHLSTRDLTPETYRERYGLKADYPMVAPGYTAQRSKLAKELGLGRKGAEARAATASASTPDATKQALPLKAEPTSLGTQSKKRRSHRAKKVEAEAANA